MQAIDRAVSQEGWKIVGLLRLTPLVPFNLQNYLFGITSIGLLPYAAATFLGIIPGTILYVYLGALGRAAASGNGANAIKWTFFGIGLIATMVAAYIIARRAKAQLERAGLAGGAECKNGGAAMDVHRGASARSPRNLSARADE